MLPTEEQERELKKIRGEIDPPKFRAVEREFNDPKILEDKVVTQEDLDNERTDS